jgi:hypothetical protein
VAVSPGEQPTFALQPVVSMTRPVDAPGHPFWTEQLKLMVGWADLRAERCGEIVAQMSPAIAYWSSVANLHPQRNRNTLELLSAALRLANHVEMRFKHALACRRPSEYSPQIQPMLATPGHGTLPSGHATEAHIVAQVLWALLKAADSSRDDAWFEQLMRQASRIAVNRTVAGLHFPVDSAAGQLLGLTLGEYLVHRAIQPAQGAATYDAWHFVGTAYGEQDDFEWRWLYQPGGSQRLAQPGPFAVRLATGLTAAPSTMLNGLWEAALKECR